MSSVRSVAQNQRIKKESIPYKTQKEHYGEAAVEERLTWARNVSGAGLTHIPCNKNNPQSLAGNIENYIGSVAIPIGLAGPVRVKGQYINGYVPLPIATTEGALVSSITRGSIATRLSGGVRTQVIRQRMTRAPVFFFEDLTSAAWFADWIDAHYEQIKAEAQSASAIAKLQELTPYLFGHNVHVEFSYTTGDASGQNMTSACTWIACRWIEKQIRQNSQIRYRFHIIEGNLSGDKKANSRNFLAGRGVAVTATCTLPDRVLRRLFRTDAKTLAELWNTGEVGALHIGMNGSNINFVNVVAGVFAATGQDIACVTESTTGTLKFLQTDLGLQVSALLPSLVIGTVGGGTALPSQRDCLELMGCAGPGKVFRLAEIIAAACLSLDLSTLGAIAANEFVSSHQRLGRNRPTSQLQLQDLDTAFFNGLLPDRAARVAEVEALPLTSNSGILTNLEDAAIYGIHRFKLGLQNNNGHPHRSVVLKLKSDDETIIEIGEKIAKLSGEDTLQGLYASQSDVFGFANSHIRELAFYQHAKPSILHYCPEIFGTRIHRERGYCAILMEDLTDCTHLDTVLHPEQWDDIAVKTVLSGLAALHSLYWERYDEIPRQMCIEKLNTETISNASELLLKLTQYNAVRYPELMGTDIRQACEAFVQTAPNKLREMQEFPMTLTHNDFNTRNVCLRKEGNKHRLVTYDWELALFQNPTLDLVEFLIYALPTADFDSRFGDYAEYYRGQLQTHVGVTIQTTELLRSVSLNALLLASVRFNLYLLAHNVLKFKYLDRVYLNLTKIIRRFPVASQLPVANLDPSTNTARKWRG